MTPAELITHRDELRRRIDADDDGAAVYEAKGVELRRDAELARAELRGIEMALDAMRPTQLIPRQVFPLTANMGED